MSDDLITSLRALAAARHDDLSIAVDAVIEIERLRAENEKQRAEVERLRAYVTQILLIAHQNIACRFECGQLCRDALGGKP